MTHFEQIVEALLDENPKSIGTASDLGSASLPGELNPSGTADPGVPGSTLHGYRSIRGKYRQDLLRAVQDYVDDEVGYRQTIDAVRALIRKNFLRAFQYGMLNQAGGADAPRTFEVDQVHRDWVFAAAASEVSYFEGLMKDLRYDRSNLPWEKRVVLFTQTLDSIFDAGRVAALPDLVVVHWNINETKENCEGCIYLAENSPYPRDVLPCTPRDGATSCLSNCCCKLRTETVTPEEYAVLLRTALSKAAILQHLEMLKTRTVGVKRRRR
jgi:hypothetical protein